MRRVSLFVVLVAACSSFSTAGSEAPPVPPADGGTCATPCPEGLACREGTCGCPEGVIFVAPPPAGSDTNTGCFRDKPKQTIGGALAFAQTSKLVKHEIHVCRGVYVENLKLVHPTTLRGGYECALWKRSANWGFVPFGAELRTPGFDRVNETRIETTDGSPALTISGSSIDRGVVIEGFTMVGKTTPDGEGVALRVEDHAAPSITDNAISGALEPTGSSKRLASIGIDVDTQAAPDIAKNKIYGGGPTSGAFGPAGGAGIRLGAVGKVSIHDNEIDSGRRSGTPIGTVAIVDSKGAAPLVGESAIRNNHILFSGEARTDGYAAAGIVLLDTKADVIGNVIYGDTAQCAAPNITCATIGVRILSGTIQRNLIFGGEKLTVTKPQTRGVLLEDAQAVEVTNNFIHTGAGVAAFGVLTLKAEDVRVFHNTIYVALATNWSAGVRIQRTKAEVMNNLFVATSTMKTFAVETVSCEERRPLKVHNNAAIGLAFLQDHANSGCAQTNGVAGVSAAEVLLDTLFNDEDTARDNIRVATGCSGDPSCKENASCNTLPRGCIDEVFPTFDIESLGHKSMLAGLKLNGGAHCALTQGGKATTPPTLRDFYDVVRTDRPSIGAQESDGACTP